MFAHVRHRPCMNARTTSQSTCSSLLTIDLQKKPYGTIIDLDIFGRGQLKEARHAQSQQGVLEQPHVSTRHKLLLPRDACGQFSPL